MASTEFANEWGVTMDATTANGSSEKRTLDEMSSLSTLKPENRPLPHKKRRPPAEEDLGLMEGTNRLHSLVQAATETPRNDPVFKGFAAPTVKAKKKEDAWKHRLYPFDGPSIEEVTSLFKGVDLERHVLDKLDRMKDPYLAQSIKEYYCA